MSGQSQDKKTFHQCKMIPFYRFDHCAVQTCKNWSPVLETKCLLLERRDTLNSEKGMTEHEIKFFKGYDDIKTVIKNRKKAFNSVYTLLIFDKYVEFCATQPVVRIDPKILTNKLLQKVVESYPFNLKEFSLNLSTLYYLFQRSSYNTFSVKSEYDVCAEYDITDILCLTNKTLDKLAELFLEMEIKDANHQSSRNLVTA